MISSIYFLTFPSFSLAAVFIHLLIFLVRSRVLFFCSSVLFFVFFLHILPHFCCFNLNSVFLIHLLDISLSSPCSSSSCVSFSIYTSSFFILSSCCFLPLLSSFFFSLFSLSSCPSVTISSIFLVISWERCSPLSHFIHPWAITH